MTCIAVRNNQLLDQEYKFTFSDSDFLFLRGNASPFPLQFTRLKVQLFDKMNVIHLNTFASNN